MGRETGVLLTSSCSVAGLISWCCSCCEASRWFEIGANESSLVVDVGLINVGPSTTSRLPSNSFSAILPSGSPSSGFASSYSSRFCSSSWLSRSYVTMLFEGSVIYVAGASASALFFFSSLSSFPVTFVSPLSFCNSFLLSVTSSLWLKTAIDAKSDESGGYC